MHGGAACTQQDSHPPTFPRLYSCRAAPLTCGGVLRAERPTHAWLVWLLAHRLHGLACAGEGSRRLVCMGHATRLQSISPALCSHLAAGCVGGLSWQARAALNIRAQVPAPASSLASRAATYSLAESSRGACSRSTPSGGIGEVRSLMAVGRQGRGKREMSRRCGGGDAGGGSGAAAAAPSASHPAAFGLCRCNAANQASRGPRRGGYRWGSGRGAP